MMVWSPGCGGGGERDGDGPSVEIRSFAGGPTRLPPAPAPEEPRVEVIERGERPHRRLRYRPEVGDIYEIDFSMTGELALSSYGARMFGQRIDLTSSYRLEVTEIGVEGDIALDLTIARYKLPAYGPLPGETIGGGLEGRITVSDRGVVRSVDLPFLETRPQLDAAFESADFFLVLPEDPVGVGARWRTESAIMRNGISETVIETQRLVELDGDRARAVADVTFVTLPQRVPGLSRGPDAQMELESNAATATSETTVDLRAPLPLRAISRFELEASMITRGPEGIHPVSMTMAATIQAAEVGRR
jgi:hypothetical protein